MEFQEYRSNGFQIFYTYFKSSDFRYRYLDSKIVSNEMAKISDISKLFSDLKKKRFRKLQNNQSKVKKW